MLPYSVPIYRVTLVKEGSLKLEDRPVVSSSYTAANILQNYLQDVDREHFVVILLDSKNRIIGINTVSIGTLTSSLVHPREVLKAAIEHNAARIIVGHNHPSSDPDPSQEDKDITSRLKQGAEIMGIPLLDHIVLGDGNHWFSFRDEGWL